MVAVVFPGQGSQAVGMGADLISFSSAAREVFEQADAVLADCGLPKPLSRICFEGPDELLRETENAQPALVATSYAYYRAACAVLGPIAYTAGHSLGEYTALIIAGAIDFETALRLVRRRGELMRDAAAQATTPGAMAAVVNLDDAKVVELCAAADGVVVPANFNAPGQVVVSGEKDAVAAVCAAAKAAGGRAVPLKVSGAFHSPFMQPAAAGMAAALAGADVRDALVPVVQNVNALATAEADELRTNLVAQVTGSVRWTETVKLFARGGVTQVVEFGPGIVLTGLIKRTAPEIGCYNVNTADSADALVAWIP